MQKFFTYGNADILKLGKTAFLCSIKCPANIVLKTYDWAIEQRNKGECVISGFHSAIEKDVLHYLLKGTQPIILALARGIGKRWEPELRTAFSQNRLLAVTLFDETVIRVTRKTALKRNELMTELADEICIAYASEGGNLERLMRQIPEGKKIITI
jgi:hypothetical protein